MFKKSLKLKFIFYIIPLLVFVSFCFLGFFIIRSNKSIKDKLTDFGFHLAKDLAYSSELAVAAEDPVLLLPLFEGSFEEKNVVSVSVYNRKGNILMLRKKVAIEERIPMDVLDELVKEQKALKRKHYAKPDAEIYDFYSPIFPSKVFTGQSNAEKRELIGFVRVSLSFEEIGIEQKQTLFLGLLITFLIILGGVFISLFFANRLVEPLRSLTQGVNIIAKGDLDYRIKLETGDEMQELAETFNQMANNLMNSIKDLEEAKSSLEIKVKSRTKELEELTENLDEKVKRRTKELEKSREELQKRLDQLEKFQKVTVGRELKMIELKKRIREQEKRLKSNLRKKDDSLINLK